MKKIVSVILLCSLLLICLTGCTTESYEKGEVIDNESWLVLDLIDYIYQLKVNYDMVGVSFEDQIDEIKDRKKSAFHVGYTSSNYYFVCGYANDAFDCKGEICSVTNKPRTIEIASEYCHATEYIWVKFAKESEIPEYYNGEKFVVGFQFNKPLFVDRILDKRERVPNVEHFQLYEPEFSDGLNIKEPILMEDTTYIFLTSSDRRHIYHTNDMYNHRNVTIECIYLDDEFYIKRWLYTNQSPSIHYPDGYKNENDLVSEFGKYYDD